MATRNYIYIMLQSMDTLLPGNGSIKNGRDLPEPGWLPIPWVYRGKGRVSSSLRDCKMNCVKA
jgi:hypothetical protein